MGGETSVTKSLGTRKLLINLSDRLTVEVICAIRLTIKDEDESSDTSGRSLAEASANRLFGLFEMSCKRVRRFRRSKFGSSLCSSSNSSSSSNDLVACQAWI